MTTTTTLRHLDFCLPRPGASEPRVESYRVERSNQAGVVVGRPLVVRCVECGAQTVDGQPVEG